MKSILTFLLLLSTSIYSFAQKNFIDQPYIETAAKVDTLITPDRIYLSITLNEADSKNKISSEEQEQKLEQTLRKLNINIEKQLFMDDAGSNFKNYFLKGQNIIKVKQFSLLLFDAPTAGKVLYELELNGISNVNLLKTEYSKEADLINFLKAKAMKQSKINANNMAKAIDQKVGKAIHIGENSAMNLSGNVQGIVVRGMASIKTKQEYKPMDIEFKKLHFEANVQVKYALE